MKTAHRDWCLFILANYRYFLRKTNWQTVRVRPSRLIVRYYIRRLGMSGLRKARYSGLLAYW